MDQAGPRAFISRHHGQILGICVCSFGLILPLQALRQPLQRFGRMGTNSERGAKPRLGFRGLASAQSKVAEIVVRGQVIRIEMQNTFERSRRTSLISRAVLRNSQKGARSALRWKQLHRFAQRVNGSGIFLLVQKKNSQIQISLGHFAVERDGALVFGTRVVAALQRCVCVTQLEMRKGNLGLFCDKFLEWRYRGFEVVAVDISLRFIEQIVEWIRYFLRPRLGRLLRTELRQWQRRACKTQSQRSVQRNHKRDGIEQGPKKCAWLALKMLHGSMPGTPGPFAISAGRPVDLDSPFQARVA